MTIQDRYLWHITMQGLKDEYGDNIPQDVIDRVNMEMDVITHNKFTDYILIIWDIHDFCKSPDRVEDFCKKYDIECPPDKLIPLGPGRGSVGGSKVCHSIGIHECDPLRFGLYFERFLNPERVAYPDIDFDISQKYRHIVLAYIRETYGHDKVAQIITYSTLSAKSVIEEVLKSACVSSSMITIVKDSVPDEPTIMIDDLLTNEKFIKAMQSVVFPDVTMTIDGKNIHKVTHTSGISQEDQSKLIQVLTGALISTEVTVKSSWNMDKAIHIMKRLEKLNKYESVHSGGVVISPVQLDINVPLMSKDNSDVLVCQYDMKQLEELGYLKMDALGLRTVDVNHDAERLVKEHIDKDFDIRKIPYNDPKAIDIIRTGDTVGIFQIESSGFTQMMIDILKSPNKNNHDDSEIKEFMWIAAGLAMYRPGPLDAIIEGKTMVQHLIDRKANIEPTIYMFSEEEENLNETYGVMVYQEQVMKRVRDMTGCTMGRSDIFRKAMGKKDPVLMKAELEWFNEAASKWGFTDKPLNENQRKQIIDRAVEEIEKFARYGFNKAHTVEYAHICYRNAHMKGNYPAAFYTALLNSEIDNNKKKVIIIRDMLKHGIQLLPPDINKSDGTFTMLSEDSVGFGLGAIKGLGDKGVQEILKNRNEVGPFKNVEDFRTRISGSLCNVNVITNLAKCGAFDELLDKSYKTIKNRATLVSSMKDINEKLNKAGRKKGKNKEAPLPSEVLMKVKHGTISYDVIESEEDLIEYATWEKEVLNFFVSAHPIDAFRDEMKRWSAINDDIDNEDLPDEDFYIAGFVSASHETVIKKEGRNKGKSMGFITVETEFRAYEATLFPGIWESCVPYIKLGEPVVLKGKKSLYKDTVSIQGMYMRSMINSGIRDCPECHIRLQNTDVTTMIKLQQTFEQHPGLTQVYLHVIDGYEDITMVCGNKISLNDYIIDMIENEIGELSYKNNI